MPLSGLTGTPVIVPFGAPPPEDNGPTITDSIETARDRPLDFPATERALYIRDMVAKVLHYKGVGDSPDRIRDLLPRFVGDYPHLFDMIMEPLYDQQMLTTMLAMLDRMGEGALSPHQASVIVGQRLFEKSKK